MPRTKGRSIAAAIACTLALSAPAGGQDIRRIDDRSVTRERHERAVHAALEIEGQKVQMVFHRETVPGAIFLSVSAQTGPTTSSSYRYLGFDGQVLRLRLEGAAKEPAVLSYVARSGGGFLVIPMELQYTRFQFEVYVVPDRGVMQAALLDNGHPR